MKSSINVDTAAFFRTVQRNQLDNVKQAFCKLKGGDHFGSHNVADFARMEKSGDTALHICASNGFIEIMRYLVEEEGASLEQVNSDGKTALHDAAQFAQLEALEFLLSKGANVNVVKRADWTPLMLACTKLNLDVIKALVNAGANLTFVNKDGWNCFHIAAREGSPDIICFLLGSCGEPVQRDSLINKKSRNGRKPIHTAVMHGHLEVVKLLANLSSQQQVGEEDNCGSSPLMDACRCGFQGIAEFFIDEIGISPKLVNKNGVGLLHVSAETNQPETIELLVKKYKLDVNQQSELLSFTPLHWASREGNLSVVTTLLNLAACRNIKDGKGRTPADLSLEFGKHEIYKLLHEEIL